MNTNDMKAQLATIKAQRTKSTKQSDVVASGDETSFLDGAAHIIGAVPSAAFGFLDSIKTGYKYAEAKCTGKL